MVLALPDLAAVLILFGALIFIYLCVGIVKALFGTASGTLGKLPVVGGWIDSSLHSVEHKVVAVMSGWAAGVDASIGWSLHQVAREVDWLGEEIRRHSNLLYTLGAITLGPGFASAIHTAIGLLHLRLSGIEGALTGAWHRLLLAEKRLVHSVAQGVYPRLRAVERATTRTIPKDVAGLRARTKAIEGELANLWKAIRAREAIIVDTAFVGAIAVALGRLGLSWLRCPALGRMGSRIGCAGFQILEDLLAGLIDVLVIADLCQLTKLLVEVAESSEVQGVLSGIIDGIDELLLCQGVERPPALDGYWTAPPPRQAFSALPAV